MELNSLCLKCKNLKYHVFSQKVKVSKCEVGLDCKHFVVSCGCFEPKYIYDTISEDEKKYQCNGCKYSSLECLTGVGFIDKCNNLTACNEILCNTMSKYKCKYYEEDSNKLPVPNSIFDIDK